MTVFLLDLIIFPYSVKYYYRKNFEDLPKKSWALLLDKVLIKATHLEVSMAFSKAALSEALTNAVIPLPNNPHRVYNATHRFRLMSEVIIEVRKKEYSSWDSDKLEDPAFYQGDILLLGTISHEDLVIMLLSESNRSVLNDKGFAFYEEYIF